MQTLNCGLVSINNSTLKMIAKVNDHGELCGWTAVNDIGSYADVDLWNFSTNDDSVLDIAVKKSMRGIRSGCFIIRGHGPKRHN